jgi:hypothetical protein
MVAERVLPDADTVALIFPLATFVFVMNERAALLHDFLMQ